MVRLILVRGLVSLWLFVLDIEFSYWLEGYGKIDFMYKIYLVSKKVCISIEIVWYKY